MLARKTLNGLDQSNTWTRGEFRINCFSIVVNFIHSLVNRFLIHDNSSNKICKTFFSIVNPNFFVNVNLKKMLPKFFKVPIFTLSFNFCPIFTCDFGTSSQALFLGCFLFLMSYFLQPNLLHSGS